MSKKKKKTEKTFKFLIRMKKKLLILFSLIVAVLLVFIGRLAYIELKSGERYEKIVLNQQEYSNQTIPFRRGDIVDRKGTVLATSTDVYNVILDCSVITDKEDYLEPTIAALKQCFDIDESAVREYISAHPDGRYYVLAKRLPYEEIAAFKDIQNDDEQGENVKGVWFEKEYIRNYPYNSLASALIGFTTSGNEGMTGLEDYYNSTLNGTDGRQYGYLNSDSNYEVNIKDAVNGYTVVSTIDINLQSIVEEKIAEFNEAYSDEENEGAKHIAVMMADPNTGEILAMANYPNYDLSDPWDLTAYYSDEEIAAMSEDEQLSALDEIWQNFCITYTYEPGSTAKPFTIACGLDTGTLNENMTFVCDGGEQISGYRIRCVNRSGHGVETLSGALEDSCNDALMQMSYLIGPTNFSKYQQIFNFGLRTNIDLPGERRTDSLIYTEENLTKLNLATNSFGQNFNVTMVQLLSAYCSLVNGGTYYQPHVVCRIEDENGNTIENIEPVKLKQTVSEETADTILSYLKAVVDEGTGKTAKVDGYSMGGKTGTAQKFDEGTGKRADGRYLVSFIGCVPANNPQVVIYCIVDEPNVEEQAHSTYAQHIVREILEEALPYLGIYPDEEKTGRNADLDITGETIDEPSDGDIFEDTDTADTTSTEEETQQEESESTEEETQQQ
jgi:stage V sporulation protein D (sporulation-specific penicillin-binding protein)